MNTSIWEMTIKVLFPLYSAEQNCAEFIERVLKNVTTWATTGMVRLPLWLTKQFGFVLIEENWDHSSSRFQLTVSKIQKSLPLTSHLVGWGMRQRCWGHLKDCINSYVFSSSDIPRIQYVCSPMGLRDPGTKTTLL